MVYVYDASFVGALIIPDEQNSRIDALHAAVAEDEYIFIPQLLWYEISNIFKKLVLRGRYTYDEVLSFIPRLSAIRLTGDAESGIGYTEKLLRIAQEYDLSAYDAAYLELAGRKKAVLCTTDGGLQRAADRYGLVTLK
jgi:predicted nucleic acid-binding protein